MKDRTPIPDAELDMMLALHAAGDEINPIPLIAEVRALRGALIGVAERDGNCWCPRGINSRAVDTHEPFCVKAKAALPAPAERRE